MGIKWTTWIDIGFKWNRCSSSLCWAWIVANGNGYAISNILRIESNIDCNTNDSPSSSMQFFLRVCVGALNAKWNVNWNGIVKYGEL